MIDYQVLGLQRILLFPPRTVNNTVSLASKTSIAIHYLHAKVDDHALD